MAPRPTPELERFRIKISPCPITGCWWWTGSVGAAGYGGFGQPKQLTHRVAWRLFRGAIPAGLHVLHRCDQPTCVNPDHLFLGTHLDNMRDREMKGRTARGDRNGSRLHPERLRPLRGPRPAIRGENNPKAKLSEADVRSIRAELAGGATQASIASGYRVSAMIIGAIARRECWAHVH